VNPLAHLLESTVFAGAVWLATLPLRRNRARTRHALWMAASVKFLVPFALIVALGSHVARRDSASVPPPQMRFVMADAAPAVPISAVVHPAAPVRSGWRPPVLWLVWLCGCVSMLIRWYVRWHRAALRLRESAPWSGYQLSVPVVSSVWLTEPGVFGVVHPVLMLPAGIEEHLSAAQLQAVMAHEICHIRHRDNLAAVVHMLVEALFWFHPLVWWMGARLLEERERACDEEVLQLGSDPAVYAESILRVCQWCLQPPVPCVSGITGADLKGRIRSIMSGAAGHRLEPAKKLLLAGLAVAAVGGPLAIGLTHPVKMGAQTAAPLRFDVASVKVSTDQDVLSTRLSRSGGRIRWSTQLLYLIGYAYHIEWWRISPEIPGSGRIYDVEATTDPSATDSQLRLMFQALLADRFKMAVHRVTKDVDGYALTPAKNGPKMQEAKEGEMPPLPEWVHHTDPAGMEDLVVAHLLTQGVGAITGRRVTMLQFTEELQRLLGTAVFDQTGLTGKYYFALLYATGDSPPEAPVSDLFSAVKQLGLKLEKHKGPVEVLVVDHIEKTPTEN
jgi:uncharacterized protein (TIGR03435 family)